MSRALLFLVTAAVLAAPAAAAPAAAQVHVYFLRGEHGVAVTRTGPATTPARTAVQALLAGPTPAERRRGLTSAVPAGTRLLGLSVRNGTAWVNLSRRFGSGGGSASMNARLGQLVFTVTSLRGVNAVELAIAGRTARVFGSEGLILHQPLTRAGYAGFAA